MTELLNATTSTQGGAAGAGGDNSPHPDEAQPPYHIIANALLDNEVVPFLGAGVNYGVLPIGAELSRSLAKECNFPSNRDSDLEDLAKVSSYFEEVGSRNYLRRYLRKTFSQRAQASEGARPGDGGGDIHSYLAGLGRPLLIVTTNYDDLTEAAFKQAGRPFDLVIHPTDREEWKASVLWWEDMGVDEEADARKKPKAVEPNKLEINTEEKTVIYKMHGTVNRYRQRWDSYVITEDDYVEFLVRMTGQAGVPARFMRHFQERRFLFLGYGLRDWNFRVVLRNLRSFLSRKNDNEEMWLELVADLQQMNPMIAESLRRKIITPAQAVKILEVSERQAALAAGIVEPDEPDDGEDEDEPFDAQGPSWAVQYKPTILERRLWERRGVDIYDVKIGDFVRHLSAATGEVVRMRPAQGGERHD